MYRKRKKKRGSGSKRPIDKYPMIYGYYDDESTYNNFKKKKKKNKIKTIMGLTPLALESLCQSIPMRTDIRIKKTYIFNFK